MSGSVSEVFLSQISRLVANHMGLYFPTERWPDLERGICTAAADFGFHDPESCLQWLLCSPLSRNKIEILASHLTVGETYFFRDKPLFEALSRHILPDLQCSRRETDRRLRIWSAGCATGEEPYSIAILLSSMIPDLKDWNLTILATDINPRFLQKAAKGTYSAWSFRDTPPGIKEHYFKRTEEGCFHLAPRIKGMVSFAYLNLAEDTYPSLWNDSNAMDVIFCRNVLMYFHSEHREKVWNGFYNSLLPGGWLIMSPSEAPLRSPPGFRTVNFPGVILFRKDQTQVQKKEIPLTQPKTTIAAGFRIQTKIPTYPQTNRIPIPEAVRPQKEPEACTEAPLSPYEKAYRLYLEGRYEEAAARLSGTIRGQPKVMVLQSRIYANQGRLNEALSWCDRAVDSDSLNPGFYFLRATILLELGRRVDSAASLKRALYLDPEFVLAHFLLGNLTRQEGKSKESERHLRNALTLLEGHDQGEVLSETDGLTAGRLAEIITALPSREAEP